MVKFWVLLCLMFLYAGCNTSGKHGQPAPPDVFIGKNDLNLYRYDNLWRYKGRIFSGYITQEQADKKVIYKLPVVEGLANGLAVGFFENGHKMLEQYFVDERLQGPYKQWWRNGQYKYLFFYKKDKYEGTQKVFFENGKLREESNFSNGKPEGLQRVWNENGELISNYTIRNNKLYGIIKVKSCIPVVAN
jgi:antitoxin component YwqK of YwqJK toxin-antitoxin module